MRNAMNQCPRGIEQLLVGRPSQASLALMALLLVIVVTSVLFEWKPVRKGFLNRCYCVNRKNCCAPET